MCKAVPWGFLACLAGVLTVSGGCQPDATAEPPQFTITGAGSTFAAPLIDTWSEQYHKRHPDVVIDYAAVGSGEGESRFRQDSVDFGATDAGLPPEGLAAVAGGAVQIPITAGIIVLAYNPERLPSDLKLPRAAYVDAFLGRGTKWNDERIRAANPGAELPDRPINIVVRQDSSGTTFAFTNHLAAVSADWRDKFGNRSANSDAERGVRTLDWPGAAMTARGNSGVAGRIKQTEYALGYVQYGAARELDLGMASLENKAGNFVSPSGTSGLETLLNARLPPDLLGYFPDPDGEYSYPIVTLTWMLVHKQFGNAKHARQLEDFVRWCLTNGQDYAEAAGNIRLAPQIVRMSESALDSALGGTNSPPEATEEVR